MKKKFWVLLMTLCVLFGVMYTPVSYADDISIDKQTQNEILEKVSDSGTVQPTVLGGTIADGTYYIKNCYSNKYLTASGGSIAAGTSVVQQEKLTGDAALPQLWRIYHLGNEQYTIRPFHKLDMTMGRTAQDIDLAYRGATDEELTDIAKWRMTQASTGWHLSLYGYTSNYVMSLATASSNNGTRITFAQKSNSASKMWILESIPTLPTGVALYNTQSWIAPRSKVSFRASVYSGNTIDQSVTWSSSNKNIARVNIIGLVTGVSKGTATITARSTYNTNWSASYTVNVGEMPNGTYYIKSMQSGKVVDIKDSNTAAGESIHQFDFEGTNDQKWIFELQQDGYYTIKSVHSNLYLSVKDNSSSSSAAVVQNPDGNADGQRWAIIKTSNGAYKIKAKCAGGADLCLKKGTYVFYPNKLVHMTYTNDSTYDDEWLITYTDAIFPYHVPSTTIKIKCDGDLAIGNVWNPLIENAVNSWNDSAVGTNISLVSTDSEIKCQVVYYTTESWFGLMSSEHDGVLITSALITINASTLPDNADVRQSTIAHEIGHLLGLADNPPTLTKNESLMNHLRARDTVIVPQYFDINNVKFVYNIN